MSACFSGTWAARVSCKVVTERADADDDDDDDDAFWRGSSVVCCCDVCVCDGERERERAKG